MVYETACLLSVRVFLCLFVYLRARACDFAYGCLSVYGGCRCVGACQRE